MFKNKYNKYQNLIYEIFEQFQISDQSICLITKNNQESIYIYNGLKYFFDEDSLKLFPETEVLPYDHFSSPERVIQNRFQIINEAYSSKNILITSIKNIFERYPEIEYFKSFETFKLGHKISVLNLVKVIESLDYVKKTNVEVINDYAVRGGIVDIFSPMYENPLRIEIFDDTIESIRFFDSETQLSIENIDKFFLSKGSLFSLNEQKILTFISRWRNYFINDDERYCDIFQKIKNGNIPEGIEIYLPLLFKNTVNFFELFNRHDIYSSLNLFHEIDIYDEFIKQRFNDENIDHKRPLLKPDKLYIKKDELQQILKNVKNINIKEINLQPENFDDLINLINKNSFKENLLIVTSFADQIEELCKKIHHKTQIISDFSEHNNGISLMYGEPVTPFFDERNNTYIFHKEVIDKDYSFTSSVKKDDMNIIKNNDFSLFKENDYVIHENYGLGIYSGLETVDANNTSNEYIKIIYADNENLYVPLSNINKITSYHKKNIDKGIALDSLSSTKWKQKKDRAIKRSIDHAAEILDIESRRQKSSSFSLRIDDKSLQEFNDEFPFTETHDQVVSFNSIQKDLSLIKPMNRVLCGDVGFGKTEVAMRAAYISAFSGKQVVLIVPSTILCDQHFNSFVKRFMNFPVSIKKLNRHTTLKNKKEIINDFNNHKIDILITTHIIFNNEVEFQQTGLLIIDEEHKFGIKQKNFIKDKQSNIHILYLSATPIPRTMNMVYAGLKDFSFLQTPPSNRLNIKSFLKTHTNQLLKEALVREKSRNGQCFIVQNDINKMENLKNEINQLLPEFRIGIAHGKLKKADIQKVMSSFHVGNLDGLICTTIVEMGLDIPNANTMIVINSQNFGLAQLHQLRGRVGRSERQGYCYYLVPNMDIPKLSKDRLASVIKNSKLGEGFLIAQEDLEIRGGGEMLGDKQSGHVENVGMSLYLSMLKSALDNTQESTTINDIEINFYDSAYIDNNYLPSAIERLKIYRKINKIKSSADLIDIKNNLIDRCGKMPPETKNIIENKKLEIIARSIGIKSIKSNKLNTSFLITSDFSESKFDKLINLVKSDPQKFAIDQENKFIYKLNELESITRRQKVTDFLNALL